MLRKSVALVSRSVHNCNSLRALSVLQSSPTESYLRHTGSEPLIHSTLGEVLLASANKYPNRVAIRSFQEDITLTYEQLIEQADALGCALRAQGLEKGDRLAIWSHNNAAWVVGLVAAARAGFIAVLLNPSYENREVSFCLKKVGVKALLIGETLPNRAYYKSLCQLIPGLQASDPHALSADLFPELTTIIAAGKEQLGGTLSLDKLVKDYANQDANKYSKELTPQDGSLILFTSGTTGEPKAVLDSNLGVVNNTYFVGKRLGCQDEVHNIAIQSPLFHALGSIVSLLAGLSHGSTATLATRLYNVTANLQALAAEKCSLVTGTPTMYVDMLALIEKSGFGRLSHLKAALAAGAPCSPELIRQMQRHLHVESVKNLYGLSETTAGVFHSLPGDSVDMVAETVGYITDHTEVKVIDDNGNTVPWGAPGELAVRGYHTMLGYWDEPKKTRETLTEDGWILTGDKFTISQDGYGRIVGRIKDIIVRGGENIAPKEIEDLLNTHPDIIESQVVGVPDERVGEEICVVVRVRPGAAVTLHDATAHLSGNLARYKMPRILKTVDDFPKTMSGKIQKFKIKDLIEAGKL